jgi:DNA-binding response OmpR family regulator
MARILIVDDDPDVVEACRLFLEKERHDVTCAYSRAEGMRAIAAGAPDLLILDVMMQQPDDGIAMAQELRRGGFSAPILMLTSIARVTGMTFGRDDDILPVDDFQEKPLSPATLARKVNELLATRVR